MLEIGSVIDGKYKILNVIGKGGMSVVYLAMNEKANKQWAIKEISKDGQLDYEVVRQNLIIETDLLKQLSHKHLPSIVDVIDEGDNFLIVMDYIEGIPLSKKLSEEGALPQEAVIDYAKQLCSVLGYLHTRNSPIIYRDLKPANVMLKPDGSIVLIDFGTARVFKQTNVEDTHCLGTKGYAAPEQYGGHGQTDARTDIYCLGSTKDHCSFYSVSGSGKRPIYWLFDSGKENGFKALIYMHRYTQDTVGLLRSEYLKRTQEAIEKALKNSEYVISTSVSAVDRASATKSRDKYIKQLSEIRIYYQALSHIALQRIKIDLDDGVKANYAKFQGVEISNEGTKKQTIDLLAKI